MGDFQDVFGAGADVEAVIDGIVAQELRAARDEAAARAPEPVRLWFATLYEAERWAEERPEVNYLRRPHLGGYEMIVPGEQFSRSPEAFYDTGAEVALARLPEELRAEGGRMRSDLRLAEGADNHAGALLRDLCAQLPLGRARQFPLRLTLGELCVTMNGWNDRAEAVDAQSPAFCHHVDPRQGTVTILAKDHTALVALVTPEGELRLEPWVFEAGPRGRDAGALYPQAWGGVPACGAGTVGVYPRWGDAGADQGRQHRGGPCDVRETGVFRGLPRDALCRAARGGAVRAAADAATGRELLVFRDLRRGCAKAEGGVLGCDTQTCRGGASGGE